jgi:hypothetical protein
LEIVRSYRLALNAAIPKSERQKTILQLRLSQKRRHGFVYGSNAGRRWLDSATKPPRDVRPLKA